MPRWTSTLASRTIIGLVLATVSVAGLGFRSGSETSAAISQRRTHLSTPLSFPLTLAQNHRYLVDRHGKPFLVVGDSPQALIGNLGIAGAARYIADRRKAGFNTLWIDLLCKSYTGCRRDGSTFDGIKPFRDDDLTTPNPAYFARADAILRLAQRAGMLVFLDPIETGGWLDLLRQNGADKARAFGRFVGRRYRQFANIVWSSGNDFQTWHDPADDTLALAVARGIRSVAPTQLQTVELEFPRSASRDDSRWSSLVGIDSAYTYYATYAEVLGEYKRRPPLPVIMAEAGYEFEQNSPSISPGDPPILRRQEYWSMLSGAAGGIYGNHYTWQFAAGWENHIDTEGSREVGYLVRLFRSIRWSALVPDTQHRVVVTGLGNFTSTGNVGSSSYVTAASTPDGTLAVAYLPAGGTITVALGALGRSVAGSWYDPTSGTFVAIRHGTFHGQSRVRLTPPGANAAGSDDWVIVLTARLHLDHHSGPSPSGGAP